MEELESQSPVWHEIDKLHSPIPEDLHHSAVFVNQRRGSDSDAKQIQQRRSPVILRPSAITEFKTNLREVVDEVIARLMTDPKLLEWRRQDIEKTTYSVFQALKEQQEGVRLQEQTLFTPVDAFVGMSEEHFLEVQEAFNYLLLDPWCLPPEYAFREEYESCAPRGFMNYVLTEPSGKILTFQGSKNIFFRILKSTMTSQECKNTVNLILDHKRQQPRKEIEEELRPKRMSEKAIAIGAVCLAGLGAILLTMIRPRIPGHGR